MSAVMGQPRQRLWLEIEGKNGPFLGCDQIPAHRLTHDAKADKPDGFDLPMLHDPLPETAAPSL